MLRQVQSASKKRGARAAEAVKKDSPNKKDKVRTKAAKRRRRFYNSKKDWEEDECLSPYVLSHGWIMLDVLHVPDLCKSV